MPGKVPEEVKTERSARLIDTQIEMTREYMQRHIGRTEKVLIEEQQVIFGKKYMVGHTPDYIMTAVSDLDLSPGDAVDLKLTGILTEEIMKAEEN